eukprot:3432664-Prymnesium_polylepis.1
MEVGAARGEGCHRGLEDAEAHAADCRCLGRRRLTESRRARHVVWPCCDAQIGVPLMMMICMMA